MKLRSIGLVLLVLFSMTLTGCSSATKRESTGEYIDSAAITAKVKAALIREKDVHSINIQVSTYKNIVQLSGFVRSEKEKRQAKIVAENVVGVVEVKNDLIVRPK